LVVLELVLPDSSGTDICRRIRSNSRHRQPAIIVLSSRCDEIDRVVSFEVGADDYMAKPFSVRELLLRARRRIQDRETLVEPNPTPATRPHRATEVLRLGPIEVHPDAHRVFKEGDEVPVTKSEMALLVHLLRHRGHVRSRADLRAHVWGYRPAVSLRSCPV
jgi:DNA-binding response OmpR family regulator